MAYKDNKNNNRYGNNYNNRNYNSSYSTNYKKREEEIVNIDAEIINYLKNPKSVELYKLFNEEDGIIKKQFNVKGGSQLRKFYNTVVDINDKYENMKLAKGKLAMILPIVYYSKERKLLDRGNIISTFINQAVKTLNDIDNESQFKDSLKAFKNVFQAVIAYTKE